MAQNVLPGPAFVWGWPCRFRATAAATAGDLPDGVDLPDGASGSCLRGRGARDEPRIAAARADDRPDLPGIPDAQILEPAYHLDRGTDYEKRTAQGFGGAIGLGAARYHGIDSVIASVAVATGWRNENLLLVDRGELTLADTLDETRVLRGRYRTLAEAAHRLGRRARCGGRGARQPRAWGCTRLVDRAHGCSGRPT